MLKLILLTLCTAFTAMSFGQRDGRAPLLLSDTSIIKPKIVALEVSRAVWKKVNKALDGVDPKYYHIEYVNSNNEKKVLGSAELSRLTPVTVYGSRTASISTGNIIQVMTVRRGDGSKPSEFIKLIWSAEASGEIAAKVAEVDAILQEQ